jgi:hypothetical protein
MSAVWRSDLARSREQQWEDLRDFVTSYAAAQPVRRVAVVGNAPLLPSAERAAALDASDLVFRANSLMLDEPGDPPCLGTTCHVVLLSHATRITRWVFQDYRRRAYLVPQMGFPLYYVVHGAPEFWPPDLGALPIPNAVVKARLADLLDPDHVPGRLTPTSGTTALFLAHEMFPDAEMLATGFSFVSDHTQTEWSHHSGGSTAVHRLHDLAREGALLRSWIEDGSVRFFD